MLLFGVFSFFPDSNGRILYELRKYFFHFLFIFSLLLLKQSLIFFGRLASSEGCMLCLALKIASHFSFSDSLHFAFRALVSFFFFFALVSFLSGHVWSCF